MDNPIERYTFITGVIRWTARIWSIAVIVLELLLIIGEGINPTSEIEWIGLIFFPLGISVGMILAWWREGFGGSITVGSLVSFYTIHYISTSTFPDGWGWILFSVPGFLFMWCWYRSRKTKTTDGKSETE